VVVGLGIDVLDVPRMDEELRRTPASPSSSSLRGNHLLRQPALPAQHYAVRFAAKEAVFKALGVDAGAAPRWRDVEVVLTPGGGREVALHGTLKELAERRGVRRMHLSLSHTRALAMAGVILES